MSKKRSRTEDNHFERVIETSREEEIARLGKCVERLREVTRIARTRNFANASSEIHRLQEENAGHLHELDQQARTEIQELKLRRSELSTAKDAAQEMLEKIEREAGIHQFIIVPKARQTQHELENHISALNAETLENKRKVTSLEEHHAELLEQKRLLEAENRQIRGDVDHEKSKMKKAIQWQQQSENRADSTLKDFHLFIDRTKREHEQLAAELGTYNMSMEEMEQNIRARFDEEVKEEIESKKRKYRQDREGMMATLAAAYTEKEAAMAGKLTRRQKSNHDLRERLDGLTAHNEQRTKDAELLAERVRKVGAKVARLAMDLEQENNEFASASTQLKVELQRLRKKIVVQDRNFDDMKDMKVAVEAEMARYRELLDYEEHRLGYISPPPAKKSRSMTDGDD
jgi:chromosome segregation ATPase